MARDGNTSIAPVVSEVQQDILISVSITLDIEGLSNGIHDKLFRMAICKTDFIDMGVEYGANQGTVSIMFPADYVRQWELPTMEKTLELMR